FHDGIGLPQSQGLLRVERRVNAAENYDGSALFRETTHGVAAKSVAGVNADTDDVTRPDFRRVQRIQCLVPNQGVTKFGGRCRREHIQPARGDHGRSEGCVTWIHEMNFHHRSWYLNVYTWPIGRPGTCLRLPGHPLRRYEGHPGHLTKGCCVTERRDDS